MNWENLRINNNDNINHNYDVSVSIAEDKYQYLEHGKDSGTTPLSTEIIVVEPEIEKISAQEQHASRRYCKKDKRNESDEDIRKSYEEETKSEGTEDENTKDELDGSRRSISHSENIEEDADHEELPTTKSNTYAAKKTVAQGMMDIALITANANQLRYLIEFNSESSTFVFTVALIVVSLCLQICVGMALIFKGRLDIKGKSKDSEAKKINNYVVVAIFLVTIINVFIASFTITGGNKGEDKTKGNHN